MCHNESGQVGREEPKSACYGLPVPGITDAVQIGAGARHSCARLKDGTFRCWGANEQGQLGDGTTAPRRGVVVVNE